MLSPYSSVGTCIQVYAYRQIEDKENWINKYEIAVMLSASVFIFVLECLQFEFTRNPADIKLVTRFLHSIYHIKKRAGYVLITNMLFPELWNSLRCHYGKEKCRKKRQSSQLWPFPYLRVLYWIRVPLFVQWQVWI